MLNHIAIKWVQMLWGIERRKKLMRGKMQRLIIAACFAMASFLGVSTGAEAAYRIEHTYYGNNDAGKDRMYVRDSRTGKRLVLSRHWGAKCRRSAALNYGLGGGCWYPVRERYAAWRRQDEGWLRLGLGRRLKSLFAENEPHRNRRRIRHNSWLQFSALNF